MSPVIWRRGIASMGKREPVTRPHHEESTMTTTRRLDQSALGRVGIIRLAAVFLLGSIRCARADEAPKANPNALFSHSNIAAWCIVPYDGKERGPAERAEMEKQTSGYLKNVTCTVAIRIERALIAAAIAAQEHQFESPPQPVACDVTMPGKSGAEATPDHIIPITGNFAPKVTIKNGVAVQATPGLTDVKGVSRIISVPVVAYINRAGFMRDGMLKIVNAWMTHMRATKTKAG